MFVCAGVLEVLNCLLSAGEVPGLFSSEELSKELAALDSKRDKDTHYQVL
jgi:dynein heavy chain 2